MSSVSVQSLFTKVCNEYSFKNELKVEQVEVFSLLLKNNNVFVVLPTGFGKSLFFINFKYKPTTVNNFRKL
jgi:superfamily II DNA helicase RecQ